MKKILFYICLIISVSGVYCIKDRSTLKIHEVSPIVIDTTGLPPRFVVFQFDSIKLKPEVIQEGKDPAQLKYRWTMNAYQGYERVVGTEKELKAKITEAPNASLAYTLILTVTDTTTGLKAFFTWDVSVNSAFGEGLIVADTRDETNSDLSLIVSFHFNPGFLHDSSTAKILRNAYSQANSSNKVNGIIHRLNYMRYNSEKNITLLTGNEFIRIDGNSYQITAKNGGLFVLPPETLKPDNIQTAYQINQHQYIINDGKGYGRYGGTGQFVYPFLAPDPAGYSGQKICGLQRPASNLKTAGILYDEKNNRFLLLPRMTTMTAPLTGFMATDFSSPAPAFDPNTMGNKTCLQMFEGYDQRIISIMKTRDKDEYFAYQIKLTEPLTGKMGIAMNDISNNPEITASKFFTGSTAEQVLFYATDKKVYSTTLEIGSPSTTSLRYSVGNNEKITGMEMHTGTGRMYLPSTTEPGDWEKRQTVNSANRLLVLSIYNETTKEGKIVAIPLEILGVGGLVTNPDYIRTYDGFGRITAFSLQAL